MAETKKFCIHSDGLGYCDVLSDDTVRHYCVEGPCPHEMIVEYAPVKHGRWKIIVDDYDCEMMKCSCCGSEFYDGDNDTVDCMLNYCPNCGAKMEVDNG